MKALPLTIVTRHAALDKYVFPTTEYKMTPASAVTAAIAESAKYLIGKSRAFLALYASETAIAAYKTNPDINPLPDNLVQVMHGDIAAKAPTIAALDAVIAARFQAEEGDGTKGAWTKLQKYDRVSGSQASAGWTLTEYDSFGNPAVGAVTVTVVNETPVFDAVFRPEVPTLTPMQFLRQIENAIDKLRDSVDDAGNVQTPTMTGYVLIVGSALAERIYVAEFESKAIAEYVGSILLPGSVGDNPAYSLDATIDAVEQISAGATSAIF